jgi:histidine phosphotransfer protein HptB
MRYSEQALNRMKEAIGGDDAVLADILQSFVDEAEALSAKLREPPSSLAPGPVARIVHTIKSSARDFGDDELAILCAAMEGEARNGAVSELERRALDIAEKCQALGSDIAAYVRDRLGAAAT